MNKPERTGVLRRGVCAVLGGVLLVASVISGPAMTWAEDGWTPLHRAAQMGKTETVRALVEAGAAVNARVVYGWEEGGTPLHAAAMWGDAEQVRALMEAGADARARTKFGTTPFQLASTNDKLKDTDAYWRLNDAQYQESK